MRIALLRKTTILFVLYLSGAFLQGAYSQNRWIGSEDKGKAVAEIGTLFIDKYVFPDLGRKYAEGILSRMKSGAYESVTDAKAFADSVTKDLQAITHDKHITFRWIESSDIGEAKEGSLHHPVRLFRLIRNENYGFQRLDWMEENIGYLDIRRFNPPSIARGMVVAAMDFLKTANAIIIDLRENQGGTTDILPFFCAYFFKNPIQLNSDYSRESDATTESWTTGDIVGKSLADIPLFLLTGKKTFSAAESFAYDMKVRKRATIVGDSTRGGAHSVDLFKIGDRFEMYLSTGRSFNPVTGGTWEGTGVLPDIPVPAGSALDTALVLARKAAREHGQAKDAELKKAVAKMQEQLNRAQERYHTGENRLAKAALDSAFQTGFGVDCINEFFVQVLAYDYRSRQADRMLMALLNKNIETFPNSSNAYELLAWYGYEHGDKELAIRNFEKALALDRNNTSSIEMLKKLIKPENQIHLKRR